MNVDIAVPTASSYTAVSTAVFRACYQAAPATVIDEPEETQAVPSGHRAEEAYSHPSNQQREQ